MNSRTSVLPTALHHKGIYERICSDIQDNPEAFFMNPGRDFTSNRKLPLKEVLTFITGIQGGSLKKELYDKYSKNLMTVSALVQQRGKLKSEAFIHIFNKLNELTSGFDTVKYRVYRLYAIDGSDINVAREIPKPIRSCRSMAKKASISSTSMQCTTSATRPSSIV